MHFSPVKKDSAKEPVEYLYILSEVTETESLRPFTSSDLSLGKTSGKSSAHGFRPPVLSSFLLGREIDHEELMKCLASLMKHSKCSSWRLLCHQSLYQWKYEAWCSINGSIGGQRLESMVELLVYKNINSSRGAALSCELG